MAMRLAVVKSGLRKDSRSRPSEAIAKSISRSMMAPVGRRPDGRHAAHDLGGLPPSLEAADGERALRHGIDIAVGAQQRRDQKGAALQAFGIAHGGSGNVDAGALGGERRQGG